MVVRRGCGHDSTGRHRYRLRNGSGTGGWGEGVPCRLRQGRGRIHAMAIGPWGPRSAGRPDRAKRGRDPGGVTDDQIRAKARSSQCGGSGVAAARSATASYRGVLGFGSPKPIRGQPPVRPLFASSPPAGADWRRAAGGLKAMPKAIVNRVQARQNELHARAVGRSSAWHQRRAKRGPWGRYDVFGCRYR